jgi:hypothetical protein
LLDRHEVLQAKSNLFGSQDADDGERHQLLDQFDGLIADLRQTTARVQTTDDFERLNNLLSNLASQWQSTFSSVLGIPRDIRGEIGLPLALEQLKPTPRRFFPEEVTGYLQGLAHDISRNRKLAHLNRFVSRLTRQPELIDAWIPSNHEETLQDWYNACLFLASEVLNGGIRFVEQLHCESFDSLATAWLSDVKGLIAYLAWERDGEQSAPYIKHNSYFSACEILHRRVLDSALKSPPENFKQILDWFERKYPRNSLFDAGSNRQFRQLIERKARRIWEQTQREDPVDHWQQAERFVIQFYGNIVAAIRERDKSAVKEVLDAVKCDAEHRVELVNAFEAALVIYGLDVELLKPLYHPDESFV